MRGKCKCVEEEVGVLCVEIIGTPLMQQLYAIN